jgi:hypothetical protein
MEVTAGSLYTIDNTAPRAICIVSVSTRLVNSPLLAFNVSFSEAVVGVDVDDFVLKTTGNLTGARLVSVSGSGRTYTVTVHRGMSGSGILQLRLDDDDSIVDLAGNPLGGVGVDNGNLNGPTVRVRIR